MTKPRKELVALDQTPFYHCYVRCVRRAFLCGDDYSNGQNYDHRKQWIVSRIRFLSYIYAIDICAYAVMSNHYHVVLHVNKEKAEHWTREEVVERWMQLYKGNLMVSKWLKEPDAMCRAEMEKVEACIEEWRRRLYDIGWFMRGVNEKIARMANEEENCKGRFWEGRFRSQALLDEAALLSCMAYVDLNPIRAGIEEDIFESDYTSIQLRIYQYASKKSSKRRIEKPLSKRIQKQEALKQEMGFGKMPEAALMPFSGSVHTSIHRALPFTREDYFLLVESTGRVIRNDKRGFIPPDIIPVIMRLGIKPDKWLSHVKQFGQSYAYCAGGRERIDKFTALFHRRWGKGKSASGLAYA